MIDVTALQYCTGFPFYMAHAVLGSISIHAQFKKNSFKRNNHERHVP